MKALKIDEEWVDDIITKVRNIIKGVTLTRTYGVQDSKKVKVKKYLSQELDNIPGGLKEELAYKLKEFKIGLDEYGNLSYPEKM